MSQSQSHKRPSTATGQLLISKWMKTQNTSALEGEGDVPSSLAVNYRLDLMVVNIIVDQATLAMNTNLQALMVEGNVISMSHC